MRQKQTGFTIVELLIVIVIIGILAAITIVAYNGIQNRARVAAQSSVLSQASKTAHTSFLAKGAYPAASALPTNSGISLDISSDAATETFCITATGTNYSAKSINQTGTVSDGPCDGHSGGATYCPNSSYVNINGYFCDGTVNSVASQHTNAVKLDASTSPIPAGAPGSFVGRQASRDNLGSIRFTATAGEVYCVSGWASTVTSTVQHRLGVHFQGSYGNTWLGTGASADSARNTWVKISGCVTAPAGTTSGALWTQNDGTPGGSADAYWYQTAIILTKQ
ncbi:MAG: prepilin-type N-terminal cleavage/methylation domain-containing protein [Candidatus Saccharimonadales bacterium]